MISMELVEAARQKTRDELLADWYDDYHRECFGIGALEARSTTHDISQLFLNWLNEFEMHRLVCVEWKYCERKRDYTQPTQIAAALADLLSSICQLRAAGTCSVAVLILEFGFDKLCLCPK